MSIKNQHGTMSRKTHPLSVVGYIGLIVTLVGIMMNNEAVILISGPSLLLIVIGWSINTLRECHDVMTWRWWLLAIVLYALALWRSILFVVSHLHGDVF